jgi:diguanylate cyclase (GGDEF)-like protein
MHILIAEDEAVSRRKLEALLQRWGHEVTTTVDGATAWDTVRACGGIKLVILDWMMPGMDGIDVCRKIREREEHDDHSYTYVVLLTVKSDMEDIVSGMNAGADDYIAKPFDPHELEVRIRAGQRILGLQEQLIESKKEVERQAMYDALTGVLNHGAIIERLQAELDRAQRSGRDLSLIVADLDHFKSVNDNFGHLAGDQVLRDITQRMNEAVRKYDIVGRYGGEEFIVILPDCDKSVVLTVAERLRQSISAAPVEHDGQSMNITCSLGAAWGGGSESITANDLISRADAALYRAKEQGRDRVAAAS